MNANLRFAFAEANYRLAFPLKPGPSSLHSFGFCLLRGPEDLLDTAIMHAATSNPGGMTRMKSNTMMVSLPLMPGRRPAAMYVDPNFGDNPGASHERLGGRSLKSAGEKT